MIAGRLYGCGDKATWCCSTLLPFTAFFHCLDETRLTLSILFNTHSSTPPSAFSSHLLVHDPRNEFMSATIILGAGSSDHTRLQSIYHTDTKRATVLVTRLDLRCSLSNLNSYMYLVCIRTKCSLFRAYEVHVLCLNWSRPARTMSNEAYAGCCACKPGCTGGIAKALSTA